MKNKILDNKGETLVEVLLAGVVILMAIFFLVVSINAVRKINAKTKNIDNTFVYSNRAPYTVDAVVSGGVTGGSVSVKLYESKGYKYYEK